VTVGLFGLSMVALLWGLLRMPVHTRSRRERLTLALDLAVVAVATGLISGTSPPTSRPAGRRTTA
jgi:hypothetical protein